MREYAARFAVRIQWLRRIQVGVLRRFVHRLFRIESEVVTGVHRLNKFDGQRLVTAHNRQMPVANSMVEGKVRGTGLVYFVPKKTKFWTLKDSFVETTCRMCTRCGAIAWFGDTTNLTALRTQAEPTGTTDPTPASPNDKP